MNKLDLTFTGATNELAFTFSDLVAGYITSYDRGADIFTLTTSDNRAFRIALTANTFAELARNLGDGYQDATGTMRDMLEDGRYLYVYGVFFPDGGDRGVAFEAKHIVFVGRAPGEYMFERPDWWIKQVRQLADFYLDAEFDGGEIDFSVYRTNLTLSGQKQKAGRQETDTISRLVYGFASAYMLTGEERFLEAAEKGTQYLRDHMRFTDKAEDIVYWYHAVDIRDDGSEQKILASEFGDDYEAIPCYEQIYALAGPVQTYRVTGDARILEDVKGTINLFNRHFKDKSDKGGYYSHIDPIMLSPHTESLGHNQARKNWNSVGDHAPAYLINLYLATGAPEYAEFLEYTFDTIAQRFPDYDNSPFVQEKFFDDWSKDQTWGWQQNRAVVGHNMKISWNLMRMHSLTPKDDYRVLAARIADIMPDHGSDQQRGGWYDVVERVRKPGEKFHRFAWHDRKAWWQQEQAILAYLILNGATKDPEYLRLARESSAFYNTWFLDHDSGGIYFNVLANGLPYQLGTERGKGSHSMSGYHSFELAYLASVYTNLLITKEPMDFYFKPKPGSLPDNLLRVAPDLLPVGAVRLGAVWIDGHAHADFESDAMTVRLPQDHGEIRVRVRIVPAESAFTADLLSVEKSLATISLSGVCGPHDVKPVREQVEDAQEQGARAITFDLSSLESISPEVLRYLVFTKQKLGGDFAFAFTGANAAVKQALELSEINEEAAVA